MAAWDFILGLSAKIGGCGLAESFMLHGYVSTPGTRSRGLNPHNETSETYLEQKKREATR